jgi:hypothetical protein
MIPQSMDGPYNDRNFKTSAELSIVQGAWDRPSAGQYDIKGLPLSW